MLGKCLRRGWPTRQGSDRAYLSRVERAATYVGLEIVGKLADVLEV
jgi:hypothetical protein